MNVYRPLRAGLFFYECFRLFLLVVFVLFTPAPNGTFSPHLVYVSSNALFPLAALFVLLKPEEYRNYLTLYIAGKIIGVVSFYAWEFFSFRRFPEPEDAAKSIILLGASALVSLMDIFSVWGAWMLKKKFRQAAVRSPEPGSRTERGGI